MPNADPEILSLWGMPLDRIEAAIDAASEERLLCLRTAMERRWGREFLDPGPGHDYMAAALADPAMSDLVPRLVYGSVRSRLGSIAADRAHLANPVYRSSKATVLKRAVSWRELLDVVQSGHVWGKGNLWHWDDPRPMVFWGCERSSDRRLLTQANELSRQATVVLCEERGVPIDRRSVDEAEVKAWTREEECRRAGADWTAAVLVTCPISGSMVWPSANKENLFAGQDEHGLPPGRVKLADIDEVRIYNGQEHVWSGGIHSVADVLSRLRSPSGQDAALAETPAHAWAAG